MRQKLAGYWKPRSRFIVVEIFFWCAIAATAFVVVYMSEIGVSPAVIGMILGVNALISMFAQPFWGWVSDRMGSTKIVLMLCLGASAACYLLLFFARPVFVIAAVLMADMFFRSAAGSLLDVWIVSTYAGENKVGYGSIRLWGSIGFAAAVFVFGRIADIRPAYVIFPAYSFFMLLAVLFCAPIRGNTLPMRPARDGTGARIGGLMKNYRYMTFVLFVFLLFIPNSPFYSFLPALVKSVGGTNTQYGLMQCVKALTEVPFFLAGKRLLDRFGPVRLMVFAAALNLVQAIAYALSGNVMQVALSLLIAGPAFSIFAVGMLHYVYTLAPDGMKTLAQTLVGTVTMNLSAIVGNACGGMLIYRFQLKSLYWAGSLSIAVALAIFLLTVFLRSRVSNRNLKEGCVP